VRIPLRGASCCQMTAGSFVLVTFSPPRCPPRHVSRRRTHPIRRPGADALDWDCLRPMHQARYAVARLLEEHGDAKLTDLLVTLADCPKMRSASIHDRCEAVYEKPLP
jgi:hypothetical protein